MTKYYKDLYLQVGFGTYTTIFVANQSSTITDNDATRLRITFPSTYDVYRKIIDIEYVSASEVTEIEAYEVSYSEELGYYFDINRRFTYNREIRIQFRARYVDGQEVVDPVILKLILKPSLKTDDFDTIMDYSGSPGWTGFSGPSGYSGWSGVSGVDGVSGYSGWSGFTGYSGYSGQLPNGVRIFVQATEPQNPSINDVWINTG